MEVLITDIAQIKARVPSMMNTSLGIDEYRGGQTVVQEQYLRPYLGEALMADLLAYANSSDSGTDEVMSTLLEKSLDVSVPLLMYEMLPSLEVKISKGGIHQTAGEEYQPIYSIQRENLQNQLLKQGMTALELLLTWMDANEADLGEWADSDERTERKGLIVQTAREFTRHFAPMNNRRATYEALLPTMWEVQDTVVRNLLGEDLYNALTAELESLSGSDTLGDEWTALRDRLRPVVAKAAAWEAMPGLTLSIEAWGVFSPSLMHNERNSKVMANAQDARYIELREQLLRGCEAAKERVTDYLNANYAAYPDLWPEPEADAPTVIERSVKGEGGIVML